MKKSKKLKGGFATVKEVEELFSVFIVFVMSYEICVMWDGFFKYLITHNTISHNSQRVASPQSKKSKKSKESKSFKNYFLFLLFLLFSLWDMCYMWVVFIKISHNTSHISHNSQKVASPQSKKSIPQFRTLAI